MSRKDLLPVGKKLYKCNLHCHSTVSDGKATIEELKALYQHHGYHVICYTDHNTCLFHQDLVSEDFLPLAGMEINFDLRNMELHEKCRNNASLIKSCHLNVIAPAPDRIPLVEYQKIYDLANIQQTIDKFREKGYYIIYNHPSWSHINYDEVVALDGLDAIEVYNTSSAVKHNCTGDATYLDLCVKAGKLLYAVCADDNHASIQSQIKDGNLSVPDGEDIRYLTGTECCKGATMVYADALTYENIFGALRSGAFYSTSGPEIKALYIEDGKLCIDCSPVKNVMLKTDRWALFGGFRVDPWGRMEHVEFPIQKLLDIDVRAFRLEVMDMNGDCAYTNPFVLREVLS